MSAIIAILVFAVVVLVFQNNMLKGKFDKFGEEMEFSKHEKDMLQKKISELEIENKTLMKLMKE